MAHNMFVRDLVIISRDVLLPDACYLFEVRGDDPIRSTLID